MTHPEAEQRHAEATEPTLAYRIPEQVQWSRAALATGTLWLSLSFVPVVLAVP